MKKNERVGDAVRIRERLSHAVRILRETVLGIKGDFSITDWNVIDPIAPAQYQFLVERKIPTLKVSVKNTWPKGIDFQIQARLQDVCDWTSKSFSIAANRVDIFDMTIPLPQEKLFSYEEKTLSFDLKCMYSEPNGKEQEFSDTKPVKILAKDDMIWAIEREGKIEDMTNFVASWVTPRDRKVQELVHRAAEDAEVQSIGGLVGYQETHRKRMLNEIMTIAPGRIGYYMFHIKRGATLKISLMKVSGGANNDIDFCVLKSADFVQFQTSEKSQADSFFCSNRVRSGHSTDFHADIENDYCIVFDNRISILSSKSVQYYVEEVEPLTHEEIVSAQLGAIYRAIKKSGMNYVNAHISFAPGHSQRVKRPCDTIELKGGNCIDGSVLFASCFEAIGFEPTIVIVPGHAFVGVRSWSDSDGYFFIETTMVRSSDFNQSSSTAAHEYEQYSSSEKKIIDIKKAREEGIKPLF